MSTDIHTYTELCYDQHIQPTACFFCTIYRNLQLIKKLALLKRNLEDEGENGKHIHLHWTIQEKLFNTQDQG